MIQAMEEAYDRDRISNKQKKPALEKLKYLNTFAAIIKNVKFSLFNSLSVTIAMNVHLASSAREILKQSRT